MIMEWRSKFNLMMWRHYKVFEKNYCMGFFETGFPLFILICVLRLKHNSKNEIMTQINYPPISIGHLDDPNIVKAYFPGDNELIQRVMSIFPKASGETDEAELQKKVLKFEESDIAIQFDKLIPPDDPQNISIIIKYVVNEWYEDYSNVILQPVIGYGMREPAYAHGGPPYYYKYFVPLMYAVTRRLIEETRNETGLPDIFIQRFPQKGYLDDRFLHIMKLFSIMNLIQFAMIFPQSLYKLRSLSTERNSQIKEALNILGLPVYIYYLSWFCRMIITAVVLTILFIVCMKWNTTNGRILEYSDIFLLIIFEFALHLSIISTVFLCSAIGKGGYWTINIYILSWLFGGLAKSIFGQASLFMKCIIALLLPVANMIYGCQIILVNESIGRGVTWRNLMEKNPIVHLSFAAVIFIFLLQSVLLFLLFLYISAIFPGKFGTPLPKTFCLSTSYWRPSNSKVSPSDEEPIDEGQPNKLQEFFDEEPTDLNPGIQIKNLTKDYGPNRVVNNLSMNLYEDQITVLLGHNGAGKTTTISMLIGTLPPTKGTAIVNGYDIREQLQQVRESMGICFQDNVFIADLTVRDQFLFFAKLKGLKQPELGKEVDDLLKELNLEPEAGKIVTKLSGGMKRRVCLGIAMCGNAKVVLLDEPTSGLDPAGRRILWKFLKDRKKGRTILLTTHFMDEADVLGDRIAIMCLGELQCCGNSFFLKKKYGTGYHLIVVRTPDCNPDKITDLVKRHVPNAEMDSMTTSEIRYILPNEHSSSFKDLFEILENDTKELGIEGFGVSVTDLDEVFMKVGVHGSLEIPEEGDDAEEFSKLILEEEESKRIIVTCKNQVLAMVLKRYYYMKRNWKPVLIGLFIVLLGLVLLSRMGSSTVARSSMKFDRYVDPIILVENNGNETDAYVSMLKKMGHTVEMTTDISDRSLQLMEESIFNFKSRYIVATSLKKEGAYAWFNNEAPHSVPQSVLLLLTYYFKRISNSSYDLMFYSDAVYDTDKVELDIVQGMFSSVFMALVLMGMSYSYGIFIMDERRSQFKHMQLISGINIFIFHFVSYLWDFLHYMVMFGIVLLCFAVFDIPFLSNIKNFSSNLSILLICYGVAVIPWFYLATLPFKSPDLSSELYNPMLLFTGIAAIPMKLFVPKDYLFIMRLLFPTFPVIEGLLIVMYNKICEDQIQECSAETGNEMKCREVICERSNCCDSGFGAIATDVYCLLVFPIWTLLILLLIDTRVINRCLYYITFYICRPKYPTQDDIDEDVKMEKEYVESHQVKEMTTEFVMILKHLTKYYCKSRVVNGLNLTVKHSECFGLLGKNGAGKTTTFKMLTGDTTISYGNAWINNYSVRGQMDKVWKHISYCPQFDALFDNLTPRETLRIFTLIRGIPREKCDIWVKSIARELDFEQNLNKQVKQLSGGNKRKLSTAISILGNISLIFMDEPTTGMDPGTKRKIWKTIKNLRQTGKSLVFTSHSMEECEALCTRLAIMVKGNFLCLGSIQHLKNKFAKSYSIKIRAVKKPDEEEVNMQEIKDYMKMNFPMAALEEENSNMLSYEMYNVEDVKCSEIFALMENAKQTLDIEYFSIGQASLEQVFLKIAE